MHAALDPRELADRAVKKREGCSRASVESNEIAGRYYFRDLQVTFSTQAFLFTEIRMLTFPTLYRHLPDVPKRIEIELHVRICR